MSLTELELKAVTTQALTSEQGLLFENDPELLALRIIYYRKLIDWATDRADAVQQEICDFIESPTFVQYPDFLTDETIMAATRNEWIEDHSFRLSQLREFELEIWGARINQSGDVEVLLTHNQAHLAHDGISDHMTFSQQELKVPPEVKIGLLKKNPVPALRGLGGEVYISMEAPYPSKRSAHNYIEVVIADKKTT